jgi:hypothetical protein
MLEKGGRRDIFLGSRECQAYVEPCRFGTGEGFYDNKNELSYGLMFHSFEYPSESGLEKLSTRFWQAKPGGGVIEFPRPEDCPYKREVGPMKREAVAVNTGEPSRLTAKENFVPRSCLARERKKKKTGKPVRHGGNRYPRELLPETT